MNRSCRQSSPCKHQPCWLNMTICSSFRSDRSLNPLHVNRGRAKSKRGHMQWEVTSSNEITYNDESNRIGTRQGTCNERSHPVIDTWKFRSRAESSSGQNYCQVKKTRVTKPSACWKDSQFIFIGKCTYLLSQKLMESKTKNNYLKVLSHSLVSVLQLGTRLTTRSI